MGEPLSVAMAPRTRPSVPVNPSQSLAGQLVVSMGSFTVHGNASHSVLTQVLGDLENETTVGWLGLTLGKLDVEGVENGRQVVAVKVDIDDGTNDSLDLTNGALGLSRVGASFADEHGDDSRR